MGLASLSRRPTPVAVGGAPFRVSPFRLWCLMDLEHWIAFNAPDPLAALDDAAPDYPDRLRAAYDACVSWPPGLGTPIADILVYGTIEGQSLFLILAMPEEDLAAALAAELAEAMTPAEWEAVNRVVYGAETAPFVRVSQLIDSHIGCPAFTAKQTPSSGSISWEKAIAERCDGDPCRYEAARNLTLTEWRLLRSGGEERRNYDPVPTDREVEREVMRLRAEFWRAGRAKKAVRPE